MSSNWSNKVRSLGIATALLVSSLGALAYGVGAAGWGDNSPRNLPTMSTVAAVDTASFELFDSDGGARGPLQIHCCLGPAGGCGLFQGSGCPAGSTPTTCPCNPPK